MLLQLDRPPLKQATSVSKRLVNQLIRASNASNAFSSNSVTRQSTFQTNGEPMSKSTHNRHSSASALNHDDNGNTPRNQHQNLNQKANDLSVMVVDESFITRFNYWDQGIREGMTLSNDLYTCFQCFTSALRFKAYDVGYSFAEKGIAVCISVSDMGYCVWLNLRSLSTEMGAEIKAQMQVKLNTQPSF